MFRFLGDVTSVVAGAVAMVVETVSIGAMELAWAAPARLLSLHFTSDGRATREQGVALVGLLTRSIGLEGAPFGLLCDAARLSGLDPGYRAVTSTFFRQHRGDCVMAVFHMGPVIRIVAEMFRIGTGTRVKGFAAEVDARAWLREHGIAA